MGDICSGGDLGDFIRHRFQFSFGQMLYSPLSHYQAAQMIWQMFQSIRYLHLHKIVHIDVKLGNFLLESDQVFRIKLIDFGFAAKMDEAPLNAIVGTQGYMAPEMLEGRGYNEKIDVWSTGISIYVLLGGFLPFEFADGILSNPKDVLKIMEADID